MSIPEGATHKSVYGMYYRCSEIKKYWEFKSNGNWRRTSFGYLWRKKNLTKLPQNKTLCAPTVKQEISGHTGSGFLRGSSIGELYPFIVIGIGHDEWAVQHPNGHIGKRCKTCEGAFVIASSLKEKWSNDKYNAIDFPPNKTEPTIIFPPHTPLERAIIGYNSVMKQPITIKQAQLLLDNIEFAKEH